MKKIITGIAMAGLLLSMVPALAAGTVNANAKAKVEKPIISKEQIKITPKAVKEKKAATKKPGKGPRQLKKLIK